MVGSELEIARKIFEVTWLTFEIKLRNFTIWKQSQTNVFHIGISEN